MKSFARLFLAIAILGLAAAVPALAEKRVALVIGNSAYKHAPALANPKNDAAAMAAALKRMKFEVVAGIDLDKGAMERLLRDFVARLDDADLALVFYAGHGLQVQGRNYFVPVDAKLERETDLAFEAVPLELVQQVMEQSRRTNILILDACRDNPLARNLARTMGTRSGGIGRGLGQTQAGIGTLIVYATQPGNVALDGEGANSPFTTALLTHIETPGVEVRLIVSRVRQAVIEATRDKQVPWDSSSLVGEVYLAAAPQAVPPQPAPPSADAEVVFWQSIKESRSAGDFKAYLDRWPNGVFAPLAKARLAELERASDDEAKRAEEQSKKAAEDQKADAERKAREEARQETERKRLQADSVARIAGQRLEQAKAALKRNQYLDAKRLAEESAALVKEASGLSPASAVAATVNRDLDAFRRDLDKRLEARADVLVREARGFIAAKKFAEAEQRLVEAERLASASTVAARRELEAAQGRAEAEAKKKAEAEAKKKAEEEAKKKAAEEAKPGTPDPKEQAQIANSWYAPERKRGLIAFAHKKATLEPSAIAALEKLATNLKDQKDYKINLVASADRLEGAAPELQALSRARLAAIQQWLSPKGIAAANLRIGIAPARGDGANFRTVSLVADIADADAKKKDTKTESTTPKTPDTADLARRLTGAEWRGVVPSAALQASRNVPEGYHTAIRFVAGGLVRISASTAGAVTGAMDADDSGDWTTSGGGVCVRLTRIEQGQQRCYTATIDDEGHILLAGTGLLGGKRFAK